MSATLVWVKLKSPKPIVIWKMPEEDQKEKFLRPRTEKDPSGRQAVLDFSQVGKTANKSIMQAIISWRVFARYLTESMEQTPVTYDTYRTIFLENNSLIIATFRMVRDFTFRLRLRSKFAMCFIVTTLLYVLAFPTLGSAMTGYSAAVEAYLPDKSGNLIPFADWKLAACIIHDGRRINKSDNFHVPHLERGRHFC